MRERKMTKLPGLSPCSLVARRVLVLPGVRGSCLLLFFFISCLKALCLRFSQVLTTQFVPLTLLAYTEWIISGLLQSLFFQLVCGNLRSPMLKGSSVYWGWLSLLLHFRSNIIIVVKLYSLKLHIMRKVLYGLFFSCYHMAVYGLSWLIVPYYSTRFKEVMV